MMKASAEANSQLIAAWYRLSTLKTKGVSSGLPYSIVEYAGSNGHVFQVQALHTNP